MVLLLLIDAKRNWFLSYSKLGEIGLEKLESTMLARKHLHLPFDVMRLSLPFDVEATHTRC